MPAIITIYHLWCKVHVLQILNISCCELSALNNATKLANGELIISITDSLVKQQVKLYIFYLIFRGYVYHFNFVYLDIKFFMTK